MPELSVKKSQLKFKHNVVARAFNWREKEIEIESSSENYYK